MVQERNIRIVMEELPYKIQVTHRSKGRNSAMLSFFRLKKSKSNNLIKKVVRFVILEFENAVLKFKVIKENLKEMGASL